MKYEKMKKLVNNVIENELDKVQLYKEVEFEKKEGLIQLTKDIDSKYESLLSKLDETGRKELLEYSDLIAYKICDLTKLYFKEGVRAGLIDLNFLNDVEDINIML